MATRQQYTGCLTGRLSMADGCTLVISTAIIHEQSSPCQNASYSTAAVGDLARARFRISLNASPPGLFNERRRPIDRIVILRSLQEAPNGGLTVVGLSDSSAMPSRMRTELGSAAQLGSSVSASVACT